MLCSTPRRRWRSWSEGLGPVYELKYAFLYGYNGTTFAVPGTSVGVHTGDLEHVSVRVDAARMMWVLGSAELFDEHLVLVGKFSRPVVPLTLTLTFTLTCCRTYMSRHVFCTIVSLNKILLSILILLY